MQATERALARVQTTEDVRQAWCRPFGTLGRLRIGCHAVELLDHRAKRSRRDEECLPTARP